MGLANWAKRQVLRGYDQLQARKNLYHLRDRRSLQLHLSDALLTAAQTWPECLPYSPKTIIDVGAHRGEVAKQFSTLYTPSFIALVEPLPQMVAVLQSLKLAESQRLFPCALGRQPGMARLNVLASLPSSSMLEVTPDSEKLFQRSMERREVLPVPIRTLDSIFDECGLDVLDLLKIDVQGYEMEVFAGGEKTLHNTRLIVTEVSFFQHYENQPLFGELYRFLHGAGFELRSTLGFIYDSDHLPLQCDAVFMNLAKL